MLSTDVILDALGRVHELVPAVLDGLGPDDLLWRPDPGANSIAWLIWHLTRVEDDHVAEVGGLPQAWLAGGWADRFALPYRASASGYGMAAVEVGAFSVGDAELLAGYNAAVAAQSAQVVTALTEADYSRIIDRRWDPPVTIAVRLVSVIGDITQHVGQAAYVRGLRERLVGTDSGWDGDA